MRFFHQNNAVLSSWLFLLLVLPILSGCGAGSTTDASTTTGGTTTGGATATGVVASVALTTGAASITADGSSSIYLRATVLDTSGAAMSGITVNFAASAGTLSATSATTNASGIAQVTLTAPTITGVATVSANYGGAASTPVTVNFLPGAIAAIGTNAQPSSVLPGGTAQLTIAAVDANANPVGSGQIINFTTNNAAGTFTAVSATTDANGRASVSYTASSAAGTEVLTARASNAITGTANLTVASNIAVVGSISLTPSMAQIAAGGGTSMIIATVLDTDGLPILGASVSFTTTSGTLSAASATTNASGTASVVLTSSASVQAAKVTGASSGYSSTSTVLFVAGAPAVIGLNAAPSAATPGGTSTITAAVIDGLGNPVIGEPLTFRFDASGSGTPTLSATSISTDQNGLATVNYTAGANAGTDIVNAITSNSITAAGASRATITVASNATVVGSIVASTSKASIPVTTGTAQISATVKDTSGNALAGQTVIFTPSSGTISAVTTTNIDGIATATLTAGPTILTSTVSASVGGFTSNVNVAFTAGAANSVTIGASSLAIGLGGTSTITAFVADSVGNPVVGETVTFAFTAKGSGISAQLGSTTAVTNANGLAIVAYTAGATAGTDTITATTSNTIVSPPISITSSATTTSFTQTITGVVATGVAGAEPAGTTVTIKDKNGVSNSGTTAAGGTYSIAVTGMNPPFMLVATKTGQQNMYSILPAMDMTSTNTQNVNITAVTTLVMYELNSGADPSSMYQTVSFTTVTAGAVSAKEVTVRSNLSANTVNAIFSMMYGQFTATGALDSTGYDSALDALGAITSITSAGVVLAGGTTYTAGSGATVGAPSVTLVLRNTADTTAATSVDNSTPALVKATVRDSNGAAVSGAIVTFTTSDPRDTFSGGANTALTDSSGVAKVTLTTSNTAGGAATVTANTTVAGIAATSSLNYAIGSSTITLANLTLPAISAYGTASVSVDVENNGAPYTTPMTVSFTSACASIGKATLTPSVTSLNGTATASYLDNGCNNPVPGDQITATLMNGVTATGNLVVGAPSIGSIQFVSVVTVPATTPTMITLKGTGGTDRSETARVTFRVVDGAGNPVGNAPVTFSLNTGLGGLSLSSTSATSDSTTGYVVTNVLAGTFSTAVRVTATTGALSTQSDQLLVSTGVPAQDSFSLSASIHNIEGWTYDGTTTTLTARLADHFHNPVPDGTAVYFTSEGGSITPSCTTVNGVCSAVLTSQDLRPNSVTNGYGRVTVLARATGEEAFVDLNSNGVVDSGTGVGTEMIDANNVNTDLGEAYVDYNEDGTWDSATEPFIDFNGSGGYNGTYSGVAPFDFVGATSAGDLAYNGILCTVAGICSTQKSIDVRGSQVIIFSSSWGDTTLSRHFGPTLLPYPSNPAAGIAAAGLRDSAIVLTSCTTDTATTFSSSSDVSVTVVDTNGNAMPAGTTVAISTSNGTKVSPASWTVPDSIGCRTGFSGCPAFSASATFGDIWFSLVSDAVYTPAAGVNPATCTNSQSGGVLTVTVTTPKGNATTYTISLTD